ncbi:MAG: aminodeoxychorismate synthase component I [Prevotella sp.]|nr:aminodeoxychorismate synthase component I [Prevotella sp.]
MKIYTKEEARTTINELRMANKEFVFIISYDQTQAYITEVSDMDHHDIMMAFPHFQNIPHTVQPTHNPIEWHATPPDRSQYEQSINLVKKNIKAGNSYLANLTCQMPLHTNLSLCDIFLRSHARYRCWVRDHFTCFSPETFIRIDHEIIHSYPMKGTIDATTPNARQILLDSSKEAAEHATIVDLIRNDLSQVAEQVEVSRYRYIEQLTTHRGKLLQSSSEITGKLSPHYQQHLGDLLFKLLPAGSITGAPKPKTTDIIREAEKYERGFYTGIMGHHADGKVDSAVMIRFIDQEDGRMYYKAGGGITSRSNNEDEYQEVIEKIYVPIY